MNRLGGWVAGLVLFWGVLGSAAFAQQACRLDAVPCCDLPERAAPVRLVAPSFGVHVWPASLAQNEAAVERLVALKPAHLRFSIGPNWRRQSPLRAEMSDAEIDAAVAAGYATSTLLARHRAVLTDLKTRTGATLHLVVWEPPPMPGEPDFTKPDAVRWRVLKPENASLAARFQVANLKFLATLGVPIDAIELSNEPDGSWNIKIAPGVYLAYVRAVRSEAGRRKVALPKIYGPGASRVATAREMFKDPAIARGILGAVDILSLHVWDDKAGEDRNAALDAFLGEIGKLGARPEIAITEYGLARPNPRDKADRMNAGKRLADSVANAPGYAAASLRDFLRLYGRRVGAVIYWEFQDMSWGGGLYGLLDTAGREKPIYRVYRDIVTRMRQESPERIDVSSDGRLAILRHAGASSLIALNPGDTAMEVVVRSGRVTLSPSQVTCRSDDGGHGFQVPPGGIMRLPYAPR